MSDRHQLTESIISRAKAMAIRSGGEQVGHLTVEHFLQALYSFEDDDEVSQVLLGLFRNVEQIAWPDELETFTLAELDEIVRLETLAREKKINLSSELSSAFVCAQKIDDQVPLGLWLKHLFLGSNDPLLEEFKEINGGMVQSEESLFDQWNSIQTRVDKLKAELGKHLTGQSTAISMLARAYRLRCQFPPASGPTGVVTLLGPRHVSKLKLAQAFAEALSEVEGKKHQFYNNPEEHRGTDEPSVLFLDNVEDYSPAFLNAQKLEEGHLGDADVSNTWVIFGTRLGEGFFDSGNHSGILRSVLTLREEFFEVLENEIVEMGILGDRQALELDLVDVLREGSLVALNSLNASDYLEVTNDFLERISKSEFPLIPKVTMEEDAILLFLLSLVPNLSEQHVLSSLKHFIGKQVNDAWSRAETKDHTLSTEIRITLDEATQQFLRDRQGRNALRICLFDDDERMDHFISQDFSGCELNVRRCKNLDEVSGFSPDIVLLDLDIRDEARNLFGLELHRRIRESNPDLPVFLFSEKEVGNCNVAEIAKNGGARGYFHFEATEGKTLSVSMEEKQAFETLLRDFQKNRMLEKQVAQRRQVQFTTDMNLAENQSSVNIILKEPLEQTVTGAAINKGGIGLTEQPDASFDRVFGLERAKERLKDVLAILKNPSAVEKMGLRPPTGFLLTGQPGTGKTFLARAFASEADIPFFQLSAGEISSKWHGESEERIRNLFDNARKFAPSIIFIDEIDSIASARSGMGGEQSEVHAKILNQLLTCMDGFEKDDKYIFVMAATNRADALDPAILRPGRFDEHIPFDLPSASTLGKMFMHFLPGLFPDEQGTTLARIKARTRGFSPAEIDHVIREAKYQSLKRDPKSAEVTFEDLDQACYQVKYGAQKNELPEKWEESEDRKRTAWHEAGHALLRHSLTPGQEIDLVTIIPHESGALGFVAWNPEEDVYSRSKQDLMNELAVLLAGREAEKMTPGLNQLDQGINSGASSDLIRATKIAYIAISQYGLDKEFGEVCLPGLPESMRNSLSSIIHERVMDWLSKAKESARKSLMENKEALAALAEELEQNDSMDGERVDQIVTKHTNPRPEQEPGNGQPQPLETSPSNAGSRV